MAQITNKEWNNLFNCLIALPGTLIQVNLGTTADPQLLQRGWTSSQISVFQHNKKLLKDHNDKLVEKQQYLDKLRKESISKVLSQIPTKKGLQKATADKSIANIGELQAEHAALLQAKVELPAMKKIAGSEIENYEFTGNEFIGAFWEWLVDLDK